MSNLPAGRTLKLIRQRTGRDCVLCSVAIVADLEYEQVIELARSIGLDGSGGLSQRNKAELLTAAGIFNYPSPFSELAENAVMVVSAPSVNVLGQMHSIVVDTRNDMLIIMDPNRGLRDRQYYSITGRPNPPDVRNHDLHALLSWGYVLVCEGKGL